MLHDGFERIAVIGLIVVEGLCADCSFIFNFVHLIEKLLVNYLVVLSMSQFFVFSYSYLQLLLELYCRFVKLISRLFYP